MSAHSVFIERYHLNGKVHINKALSENANLLKLAPRDYAYRIESENFNIIEYEIMYHIFIPRYTRIIR